MTDRPDNVYVIQSRRPRDYADGQAAIAHVPAGVTVLPFTANEDEIIARTRKADAFVTSSSPMTRAVMSALEA